MSTAIRAAAEADRSRIKDVTIDAYDEYRLAMPPPMWKAYKDNILETIDGADLDDCLLAETDGAIVGSVFLFPADHSGEAAYPEIRLLAVLPSARGTGVGQALMDACKSKARASGASKLSLHTTTMMAAALRMYERMGFVRTPETDFHPTPDLTIMGFLLDL